MHDLAAGDRQHRLHPADLIFRHREAVGRQHREVGELAGRDAPLPRLLALLTVLLACPAGWAQKPAATLKGHTGWVGAVAFSADSKRLATASAQPLSADNLPPVRVSITFAAS